MDLKHVNALLPHDSFMRAVPSDVGYVKMIEMRIYGDHFLDVGDDASESDCGHKQRSR